MDLADAPSTSIDAWTTICEGQRRKLAVLPNNDTPGITSMPKIRGVFVVCIWECKRCWTLRSSPGSPQRRRGWLPDACIFEMSGREREYGCEGSSYWRREAAVAAWSKEGPRLGRRPVVGGKEVEVDCVASASWCF